MTVLPVIMHKNNFFNQENWTDHHPVKSRKYNFRYKFDDMVVTRCDATQVAKSQPYILMYRKHTTNGEPSISQNTESPFNVSWISQLTGSNEDLQFFASRRLFSDRDSEAWDVIRKCLDEDGKEKKVAGSSRKNIRKKKKRMTKQQITDILKKASIDDVEQHYKALQQIMDDIVKSLSQVSKHFLMIFLVILMISERSKSWQE